MRRREGVHRDVLDDVIELEDFYDDGDDRGGGGPGEDPGEGESVWVTCPACAQPVALAAAGGALPRHAVCARPWDPFGLTDCPGSGRAAPVPPTAQDASGDAADAVVVALPEGLDWRLQPFSHVGGPGTRPMRVPGMRQAA